VEVKSGNNRFLGILYSAPDTVDDKYIIITKPYIIHSGRNKKLEELTIVDYIIIRINEIDEIKAYDKSILKINS